MKQVLLIIGMLLFMIIEGKAQTMGYIIKGDSAFFEGKIKFDPSNPKEVEFILNRKKSQKFNADQLSEFGYDDSVKFVAKKILYENEYQYVFLQLLEEGTINLFKLPSERGTFFLEDSILLKLEKDEYLHMLKAYSGKCILWRKQHRLIKYNKNSLSKFVHLYNLNKCQDLPFFSYGPVVGYSFSRMSLFKDSYTINEFGEYHINSSSFNIGFYTETPFWNTNKFSFLSEIRLGQQMFIKELFSTSLNQDVKIEMSYLHLNIAPKYTFNLENVKPFFFLGGSFMYAIKSSSDLFQANIEDQKITFERHAGFIEVPAYCYGITCGTGIQFFFKYDHYITLEVSGAQLFSNGTITLINNLLSIKANL